MVFGLFKPQMSGILKT